MDDHLVYITLMDQDIHIKVYLDEYEGSDDELEMLKYAKAHILHILRVNVDDFAHTWDIEQF